VPNLQDTSQKFLRTVAPLLTNDEFNETQLVVEQFQRESQPLQNLLLERAKREENWVRHDESFVLDMRFSAAEHSYPNGGWTRFIWNGDRICQSFTIRLCFSLDKHIEISMGSCNLPQI
jgi:hypothetical protein